MQKDSYEAAISILADLKPENLRAVSISIMGEEGAIKAASSGNDGDVMIMAEITSEQAKLKMMGMIKPTPVPAPKSGLKAAPEQSGAQ